MNHTCARAEIRAEMEEEEVSNFTDILSYADGDIYLVTGGLVILAALAVCMGIAMQKARRKEYRGGIVLKNDTGKIEFHFDSRDGRWR